MPTGKEICEYIVETFPDIDMTPEELWNSSSDGSLGHVQDLYAIARERNGLSAFENLDMQKMYESFCRSKR